MPTEYTLEIAGEPYPWVDLRYVRDYKFYGKLIEATIPEWVAAIAGDNAIVIKRDGVTVTSGKVKKITPFENIDKGMGMVVTGYTKEMRHATLLANARTYNADPHDIIIDDLGSSDLTDGTTNLYGSNIVVELGSSDEAKFSRKAVYEEVAFITGWELYASPTGALDFKSQCGVDRATTVAFKHGELLQNWFKPHMLNHLLKKTKIIVLGACAAEYEYYGIAGAGTDVYTIERKNLIDDNTCSLAAAAVYADMPNTLKVGAMDVIDTYVGAAYDVYDTVHVADARFGLDENVRIYRIERRIDKDGEHTRIFYTNITKLTCNGPLLLDLAKGELAVGQRVVRDFGRTQQLMDIAQLTAAEAAATGLGNVAGGTGLNNVSNDTGLNNVSGASGLTNADGSTGLANTTGPTGLGNVNAAAGLANESVGGHIHDLYNRTGYLVTGWVTRYCAATSGGPVTQAFSAPTGSTLDNYAYGTAVATGGGHNHAHGADNHGHGHGTDDHNHTHGTDGHGHGHGTDSHGHGHGTDSHGHSHGSDSHGHGHGADSHETALETPVHIH